MFFLLLAFDTRKILYLFSSCLFLLCVTNISHLFMFDSNFFVIECAVNKSSTFLETYTPALHYLSYEDVIMVAISLFYGRHLK